MGIFTFKLNENFNIGAVADEKDPDYILMCVEFNKVISKYIINQEIHSKQLWGFLVDKFKVTDKKILQKTEISVDQKNKQHKRYKYYVQCDVNKSKFYIAFFDEYRNLDDDDYHNYVTDSDKSDKVTSIIIYYDQDTISNDYIENEIVTKILEYAYVPSTKNQFFTISASQIDGFELKSSYIKAMDIDLELNYGPKFMNVHEKILSKLRDEKQGLFLFHGEAGTGKCVDGSTMVTLRNKTTGEILEISIDDFVKKIM